MDVFNVLYLMFNFQVIALPTPQTVLLVLDASNGNDIMYSGDGLNNGFTNDGTCNDVEVAFDANGI